MLKRQHFLGAFLFFLVPVCLLGQEFSISDITEEQGVYQIKIQINPQFDYERYKLELYSSQDNFQRPLQGIDELAGEIHGRNRVVEVDWNSQGQLTGATANDFQVKGTVVYKPINSDFGKIKAKHKKQTLIRWEGGKPTDRLALDLYDDGNYKGTLASPILNTGQYPWVVEKNVGKGERFQIVITNLDNPGESLRTPFFTIKGKSTKGLIFVGLLAAGGGAYWWLNRPLPDPPKPR